MIGSGLKKYSEENGLKVAHGVAYGSFHGYAATMSEGSGYKQLILTTKFPDPEKLQQLQERVNQRNITREFRVRELTFAPNGLRVVFTDNPGTMAKIRDFAEWFIPLLGEAQATRVDVCAECGMPLTGGVWKLIDGVAYYMHSGCAERIRREVADDNAKPNPGSYLNGTIGALLGSMLGAVVWALVLYAGYMASLVGLLIGWLAEKGYNLLKGKQGKAKVAILILAVIVGVLLGTFAADAIMLFGMIGNGELPGITFGDIPALILGVLVDNAEYRRSVLANIGMGLLFAGLGVFALLRKANKEVSGTKFIDLE